MAVYSQAMSEDNAEQMGRLRRNVMLAIQEDITPRQRECMVLYYQKGLNMRQIAELTGVDKSTVSRNIKRGESRLRRCLRYGAGQLLKPDV
ncbi:sigma-70 family RNA polymerase sigma factor [Flavonifractor sp. An82]|uniref:sigma-70 family RNA polymerase sigma factor n=1 Tax=Flavonifractor sp. An82 TaxID=1965660 RepID=UPI000B365F82|nr:sigma-70 family RNA polymerase sigma factor [Flavonifractor sp. An82]OUN22555.1 RNA polymerase subunit sigma-70 [Flavonifractor sp. An82]